MSNTNFPHPVSIKIDSNSDLTYSHPFPVMVGNRVQERWSKKTHPVKPVSAALRSMRIMRYKDYQLGHDAKSHSVVYHFADSRHAMMCALIAQQTGYHTYTDRVKHNCPQCGHNF